MNTITKSIIVISFFAALTISMLLLSGTFTGHMDHRWNMAMYEMRGTSWLITPLFITMGIGSIVWWLVSRSNNKTSDGKPGN